MHVHFFRYRNMEGYTLNKTLMVVKVPPDSNFLLLAKWLLTSSSDSHLSDYKETPSYTFTDCLSGANSKLATGNQVSTVYKLGCTFEQTSLPINKAAAMSVAEYKQKYMPLRYFLWIQPAHILFFELQHILYQNFSDKKKQQPIV